MRDAYRSIITKIGEDITRESLVKTPERAAKAMQFLTKGYTQKIDDIINGAIFSSDNDQMVIVKDIRWHFLFLPTPLLLLNVDAHIPETLYKILLWRT